MLQPMLEGEYIVNDQRDEVIDAQRDELSTLQRQNHQLVAAQRQLRQILGPLYQALRSVMENLPVEDAPPADVSTRVSSVWQDWKNKLGQPAPKIIDALLKHNELNTQQLAIACGLHRTSIPRGIWILNKAGLINKNGGRFSLKQL